MLTRKKILLAQKNGTLDRLYADTVSQLMRTIYTVSDEISILRQKEEKPEEHKKYVEDAENFKRIVKEQIVAVVGEYK